MNRTDTINQLPIVISGPDFVEIQPAGQQGGELFMFATLDRPRLVALRQRLDNINRLARDMVHDARNAKSQGGEPMPADDWQALNLHRKDCGDAIAAVQAVLAQRRHDLELDFLVAFYKEARSLTSDHVFAEIERRAKEATGKA